MLKTIRLNTKHDDRFSIDFIMEDGTTKEHEGYAPSITGLCSGSYTHLKIDNATGTIIGWKPIADDELEEILNEEY